MKYIGIDYGLKRIGISLSNEDGTVAFPHEVIENNTEWISTTLLLIKEVTVDGGIVFGESKDLSMVENPLMKNIREAIDSFKEQTELPIHLHPEFMTSREANRFIEDDTMHDARAAALILQHFLDSKNKQETQD
jgi:putative Holliday junction resolvase